MLNATVESWLPRAREYWPGVAVSFTVAAAAGYLAEHYQAPLMLFALLLGLALSALGADGPCRAGIEFSARTILRIGVALLGVRITFEQIVALGWQPVVLVVVAVVVTILVSMAAARAMGFNVLFGLLSGGATAICGASAALALSAALPAHPGKERATLFTVIGVSTLSTLAMIVYPVVVQVAGLDAQQAGVFLGGTIHDVAQVVGAGYSLSQETGDTATVVKLMRVAMLVPVILAASMITRFGEPSDVATKRPPVLPWFAVAFLGIVVIGSAGWIPSPVTARGQPSVRGVPRDRDGGDRHENAAKGTGCGRHPPGRADAWRDRVPRAVGVGRVALGDVIEGAVRVCSKTRCTGRRWTD